MQRGASPAHDLSLQDASAFWEKFDTLPHDLQNRAEKQFRLFARNPQHPSLQLKPVGEFWSARVNDSCRALAIREGNVFIWFWIGTHDDYERLLR